MVGRGELDVSAANALARGHRNINRRDFEQRGFDKKRVAGHLSNRYRGVPSFDSRKGLPAKAGCRRDFFMGHALGNTTSAQMGAHRGKSFDGFGRSSGLLAGFHFNGGRVLLMFQLYTKTHCQYLSEKNRAQGRGPESAIEPEQGSGDSYQTLVFGFTGHQQLVGRQPVGQVSGHGVPAH